MGRFGYGGGVDFIELNVRSNTALDPIVEAQIAVTALPMSATRMALTHLVVTLVEWSEGFTFVH